jgi:hypothetical protein
MRFHALRHPRYKDDLEREQRNPVHSDSLYCIPGMLCDVCLRRSTSDRLRIPVPGVFIDEFTGVRFLPPDEWRARVNHWANILGVDASLLTPGMTLGPPRGVTIGFIQEDFVYPLPGLVWVNEKVRRSLQEPRFKGLELPEVELERGTEHPVPRLWEIVALGRGWRLGSTQETLTACELCGRRHFPTPGLIEVDLARWDGSDFFHVDYNPNIVLVTERVREVLEGVGASNIHFEEVKAG